MIEISLKEISKIVDGKVKDEFADVKIKGVAYDSREVKKNNLYIPLPGERVNGHSFIKSAIENGASATTYDIGEEVNEDIPSIEVKSGEKAMQDLAKAYMDSLNTKVIGITGNNGKTGTKDMVAEFLKYTSKTVKTQGNQNNEIGLPFTVLHLPKDTEIAVLEMGTERFGELDMLTKIAKPDIACLLNVGDAHLDILENVDNATIAKLEIAKNLDENSIFFYNGDCPLIKKHIGNMKIKANTHRFGFNKDNDTIINLIESNENGIKISLNEEEKVFHLPALGSHNAWNLTASILMARAAGGKDSDIEKALPNIDFTSMRQELKHMDGFDVLDDAYKSNTDSLIAALETLHNLPNKRKIVVLADFLGTGDKEIENHIMMKKYLHSENVDTVFTTGPLMKYLHNALIDEKINEKSYHIENRLELIEEVKKSITKDSLILVKGSRSFELEDLISELEKLKF